MHDKAQALGFELVCHSRTDEGGGCVAELSLPPQRGRSWMCVGSYGETAGLWAHALTAARVAAIISGCCEHVGTLADYDDEFQASMAPLLAAAAHPEYGRMPA